MEERPRSVKEKVSPPEYNSSWVYFMMWLSTCHFKKSTFFTKSYSAPQRDLTALPRAFHFTQRDTHHTSQSTTDLGILPSIYSPLPTPYHYKATFSFSSVLFTKPHSNWTVDISLKGADLPEGPAGWMISYGLLLQPRIWQWNVVMF